MICFLCSFCWILTQPTNHLTHSLFPSLSLSLSRALFYSLNIFYHHISYQLLFAHFFHPIYQKRLQKKRNMVSAKICMLRAAQIFDVRLLSISLSLSPISRSPPVLFHFFAKSFLLSAAFSPFIHSTSILYFVAPYLSTNFCCCQFRYDIPNKCMCMRGGREWGRTACTLKSRKYKFIVNSSVITNWMDLVYKQQQQQQW